MLLNIQYSRFLSKDKSDDIKIRFLTGEDLTVIKEGKTISEDVIRDVTDDINKTYTLKADSWIDSSQKVDTVQAIISSTDKSVKLTSDFILITR